MIQNYHTNPDDNILVKSSEGTINLTEGETVYLIPDAIRKLSADLTLYAKDRVLVNKCISNTEQLRFERDTLNTYITFFEPSNITKNVIYNGTTLDITRSSLNGYYKLTLNPFTITSLTSLVQDNPIEYCFFINKVPTGWTDITDQYKDRFIELAGVALNLKEDDIKSHNHTIINGHSWWRKSIITNDGRTSRTGKTRGDEGRNAIGGGGRSYFTTNTLQFNTSGSISEPRHITLRLGVRK